MDPIKLPPGTVVGPGLNNGNPNVAGSSMVGPGITPDAPTKVKPIDHDTLVANFIDQQLTEQQIASSKEVNTKEAKRTRLMRPESLTSTEAAEADRYMSRGQTYLRGRDNEAVAAVNQGTWSRVWNDTKVFGVNVTGSILSAPLAIPSLVMGLAALAKGESFASEFRRGPWNSNEAINEWQTNVADNAVNFQSDWAKNNPWKNMLPGVGEGGNDFGSLVRSGGFVVGGVVTTLAETAIGTALAPFTGGGSLVLVGADIAGKLSTAFRSLATIGKNLDRISDAAKLERTAEAAYRGIDIANKVSKIWSGTETVVGNVGVKSVLHGLLLANGEASLEGFTAEKEMMRSLEAQYIKQHGFAADETTLGKFKETAQKAGDSTFLLNHIFLGISNKFQIDSILKNFNGAKSFFANLSDDLFRVERAAGTTAFNAVPNVTEAITFGAADKWYLKGLGAAATAGKKLGTQGVLALSEGVEESMQKAIQDGTQSYYQYAYNHGGKADFGNVIEAGKHGLAEAFGTEAGWMEFVGGLVIGGLFGGGIKTLTDRMNAPKVQAQFEAYAQQLNQSVPDLKRALYTQLTDSVLGASVLVKAAQTNAALTNVQVAAAAATQNDQLIYQNQKITGQFAFMNPFVQQGAGNIVREQFKTFREDINADPSVFADAFGLDTNTSKEELLETITGLENKLTQLEQSHNRFKNLYSNPYLRKLQKMQRLKEQPTVDLLEKNQEWAHYYTELLHNDFLRQQYGARIKALKTDSAVLGQNVPYTTETGWKEHKKTIAARLTELDAEIALVLSSHVPKATSTVPVAKQLERLRQATENKQAKERMQLNRRFTNITELEAENFGDYKKLLTAIRYDLLMQPSPAISNTTTNAEMKELLQKSFDAQSLGESVVKLSEQFDAMSSEDGFEQWIKTQQRYEQQQWAKHQMAMTAAAQGLKAAVVAQFNSEQEAIAHLGPLADYLSPHLDDYVADSTATLSTLTAAITTVKAQKAVEMKQREAKIATVIQMLDKEIKNVQATGKDPTGVDVRRLTEEAIDANASKNLLEISQIVASAYSKLYPIAAGTSAPSAVSAPVPVAVSAPTVAPITDPTVDPLADALIGTGPVVIIPAVPSPDYTAWDLNNVAIGTEVFRSVKTNRATNQERTEFQQEIQYISTGKIEEFRYRMGAVNAVKINGKWEDKPRWDNLFTKASDALPAGTGSAGIIDNDAAAQAEAALIDPFEGLAPVAPAVPAAEPLAELPNLDTQADDGAAPEEIEEEEDTQEVVNPWGAPASVPPVINQPPPAVPPLPPTVPGPSAEGGLLEGKLFNTGMTVIMQNGVMIPKYYSAYELEEDPTKTYTAAKKAEIQKNREHWESVVGDRVAVVARIDAENPLSSLVEWHVLTVPESEQGMHSLPREDGLQRATVMHYLVAYPKGEVDGNAIIVIPLSNTLYASDQLLTKLSASGILSETEKIQLDEIPGNVLITDLLETFGGKVLEWAKKNGLLPVQDKAEQFINRAKSYVKALDNINSFLPAPSQEAGLVPAPIELEQYLDNMQLKILRSGTFGYNGEHAISDLSFNEYVPGQKLIINVVKANDGTVTITQVLDENDPKAMTPENYEKHFPQKVLDVLSKADKWTNRKSGNFLVLQDDAGNKYVHRVIKADGLHALLDKVVNNQSFTGSTDRFYIEGKDENGRRVTNLELNGSNLAYRTDKKGAELKIQYNYEGKTYYTKGVVNLEAVREAAAISQEAGEEALQQELNRIVATLETNDKEVPSVLPATIRVQQGSRSAYERNVAITSSAVWHRVDVNWDLATEPYRPVQTVDINEAGLDLPQFSVEPQEENKAATDTAIQALAQLANIGVMPEILAAIQQAVDEGGGIVIDRLLKEKLKNDKWKAAVQRLTLADDTKIRSVASAISTTGAATLPTAVPTTRAVDPAVNDEVRDLLKQCV